MKVLKRVGVDLPEVYRVFETDIFLSDIEDLPKAIIGKLKLKIKNYVYPILKQQPYYGKNIKKLVNYDPETWRYRIGDFRLFYAIDEKRKIISILTISSRKDAY
jgi:mRNA interferase RelE/StbE